MRCQVLDFIMGSMCVGLLLGYYGYASAPASPEKPPLPKQEARHSKPTLPNDRHRAAVQMLDLKDRKKRPSHPSAKRATTAARPVTTASNPPVAHASSPHPPTPVVAARNHAIPKTQSDTQKQPPLDLPSILPSTAAKVYRKRLARGLKLIKDGVTCPEYSTVMSRSEIDGVLHRGLAKLVVVARQKEFFVFRGVLTAPGRPRLADQKDFRGFSQRAVALQGKYADRLVRTVSTEFRYPPQRLAAAIVLRSDLDAGVLAAQDQAARALGVEIKQVARTEGAFQAIQNVPFAYIVHTVLTRDGRRLHYDPDSSVHEVADARMAKSDG